MDRIYADGVAEKVGELAACSASQVMPSPFVDEALKGDVVVVDCVSVNDRFELVNGQSFEIPLNIFTNMGVSVGDVFREYPGRWIPLSNYVCPCKIVIFRDLCQLGAG